MLVIRTHPPIMPETADQKPHYENNRQKKNIATGALYDQTSHIYNVVPVETKHATIICLSPDLSTKYKRHY